MWSLKKNGTSELIYKIMSIVLCAIQYKLLLIVYFIYSNVYMLIPHSQFISPLLFLATIKPTHFAVHLKLTQHYKSTTLQLKNSKLWTNVNTSARQDLGFSEKDLSLCHMLSVYIKESGYVFDVWQILEWLERFPFPKHQLLQFSVVQLLSRVRLFATPWISSNSTF